MQNINTVLIVVVGVFLLWLAVTGRIGNIGPAWRTLTA